MSKDGLYVTCHAWAPKQKNRPHQVSREVCVSQAREHCKICPNSRFVLRLPIAIGHQTVSCPRWLNSTSEGPPVEYVQIRRELCFTKKPFDFCRICPNARQQNPPRAIPGWVDGWRDKKKRRLDDES